MNKKITTYQLAKLIYKSISKTISKEEKQDLDLWLIEKDNREVYKKIIHKDTVLHKISIYEEVDKELAFERVQQRIIVLQDRNKKIRRIHILKYAAIFIGVLGMAYFYQNTNIFEKQNVPVLKIDEEIITLTLANGVVKKINENGNEQIVNSKGKVVVVQNGGRLNYTSNEETEELIYNELYVPYGKRFQLSLSDGTHVHLNSGSSLRYPVRFLKGKSREVELTGEGYFDVAKDATRPFIVNANEINIRVLGTQFNVSSYANEQEINTVLVEGSVGLYRKNEQYLEEQASFLEPGQIGTLNKVAGALDINTVDTSIHTSWIEGKLVFRNTPFEIIRKRLERHYNVIIINNNKDLDKNTYKAIFDIESIEQVLETLNRNYAIEYLIVNNQIIIN